MKIKGIQHERLGDAPFVGALIIANDCTQNCHGCFNQHLKMEESYEVSAESVVKLVKQNPLHQGVILGGLEWTEQPEDLRELVQEALAEGLEVMVYTYMTEERFRDSFPDLAKLPIWCKFGPYREKLPSWTDPTGIKLASNNQYIKYMGGCTL